MLQAVGQIGSAKRKGNIILNRVIRLNFLSSIGFVQSNYLNSIEACSYSYGAIGWRLNVSRTQWQVPMPQTCMYVCMYVTMCVCDYVGISCLIIVYVSPAVCMFLDQRIALNEWNGLIKLNKKINKSHVSISFWSKVIGKLRLVTSGDLKWPFEG